MDLILRIQMENEMELSLQGIDVEQPLTASGKSRHCMAVSLPLRGRKERIFL